MKIDTDEKGDVSLRLDADVPPLERLRRFWPLVFRPRCTLLFLNDGATECVIGSNDKSTAWILGRVPRMSNDRIFEHAALLRGHGFNTGKLRFVMNR
jgi:lipocalin